MAYVCISIESILPIPVKLQLQHGLNAIFQHAHLRIMNCCARKREKTRSLAADEGLFVKTRQAAACNFGILPRSFYHLNLSVQSLTSSAATKYPEAPPAILRLLRRSQVN